MIVAGVEDFFEDKRGKVSVAILCSGPSLTRTWKKEYVSKYDIIIAVKRAIIVQPCHWWVSGDWTCFRDLPYSPLTGYCSIQDVVRILRDGSLSCAGGIPEDSCFAAWEDLPFQRTFSTVAAHGLAAYLGAYRVSVYGDDKVGTQDFDGVESENRGPGRWGEEIEATDAATRFLCSQGIAVNRVKG